VNRWLRSLGVRELQHPETVAALCRRPEVRLQGLLAAAIPAQQRALQRSQQHALTHAQRQLRALLADPEVLSAAEVELKYEGYIDRERRSIERLKRFEALRIPVRFDYQAIDALSRESREKLALVRPRTLGQASRISGVRPADISVLLVQLRARQAPAADGARQGGAANGARQGGT
jgi:tRNA uridine 5-carboxymethylaminomethyl modification enzyme